MLEQLAIAIYKEQKPRNICSSSWRFVLSFFHLSVELVLKRHHCRLSTAKCCRSIRVHSGSGFPQVLKRFSQPSHALGVVKRSGRGCVLPRKTPSTPKTERGDALLPAPDAGLQFGCAPRALVRAEPVNPSAVNKTISSRQAQTPNRRSTRSSDRRIPPPRRRP